MRMRTRMAAAACLIGLSTAALASIDPVLEWNAIMLTTTAGQNPFFQARFASDYPVGGIRSRKRHRPGLRSLSRHGCRAADASREAAAVAAAHAVLKNYFPGSATALDAARDASLARIADGIAKQEGIAAGEAAAAAMIALRTGDGSRRQSSTCPHRRTRVNGCRRRAVRRRAASSCSGGICVRSGSRPPISSALSRRLPSRASAMHATTTK